MMRTVRKQSRTSKGFSLLEMVIAASLASLVIIGAWSLVRNVAGTRFQTADGQWKTTGAARMAASGFLRRHAGTCLGSLATRLQDSIELLSPRPLETTTELQFRDLLGDQITIKPTGSPKPQLAVYRPDGTIESDVPRELTVANVAKPFKPVPPVLLRDCVAGTFTALSPTCVIARLTFRDKEENQLTVAQTIQLGNANLAR